MQYASETELVATGQQLVLRILDGHVTRLEDIDRLELLLERTRESATRIGFLQVIREGTPPMQPEVRRRAAELLDRHADHIVPVIALLGIGFWVSTLRLALMAFNRLLRRSRLHIEPSVDGAVELLARELEGVSSDALMHAYMRLSTEMRALRPDVRD